MNDNQSSDKDQMREYELSFLLTDSESLADVIGIVKKHGGRVSFESQVNQIRLSYKIKKQPSAFFGYLYFFSPSEIVGSMKADLELAPKVLRSLIVVPPIGREGRESTKPSARPQEVKPETTEAALTNEALEQKIEEILK